MASEQNIRFCIANIGTEKRAASWKIWSPPKKDDIYLAGRELKGAVKISLHETGTWHLAYDAEFYDQKVPDNANTDKGRFIHTWHPPVDVEAGTLLALRIVTPWTAVGSEFQFSPKLCYIDPPCKDEAIEIGVFITNQDITDSAWPGRDSLKSKMISSYILPSGSTVFAAYWAIECPDFSHMPTEFRYFEGVDKSNLPDTIRALAFGDHTDGSKVLYDLLGKVSKNDA